MTNNGFFATNIVATATATAAAVAIVFDEEWDKWRNHGQVVESMAYFVVQRYHRCSKAKVRKLTELKEKDRAIDWVNFKWCNRIYIQSREYTCCLMHELSLWAQLYLSVFNWAEEKKIKENRKWTLSIEVETRPKNCDLYLIFFFSTSEAWLWNPFDRYMSARAFWNTHSSIIIIHLSFVHLNKFDWMITFRAE